MAGRGSAKGSRATPKGTRPAPKGSRPAGKGANPSKRVTPKGTTTTGRYTPPTPKTEKTSRLWVPVMMFTCLLAGMLMIILNYVNVLPGGTANGYLLGGLGLISVGFLTATRYR